MSSDAFHDLQLITEFCVYSLRYLYKGVCLCVSVFLFENNFVKDEYQTLQHTWAEYHRLWLAPIPGLSKEKD